MKDLICFTSEIYKFLSLQSSTSQADDRANLKDTGRSVSGRPWAAGFAVVLKGCDGDTGPGRSGRSVRSRAGEAGRLGESLALGLGGPHQTPLRLELDPFSASLASSSEAAEVAEPLALLKRQSQWMVL